MGIYNPTTWVNGTTPTNEQNFNKIENGIKNLDNIVDVNEYSTSDTYQVGDYCYYNNKLQKCIEEVDTPETFDSTKWQETNVIEQLGGEVENQYSQSTERGYSADYINTINTPTSWISLTNYVKYKKVGNIVTVTGYSQGGQQLQNGDYTTVATLPASIRPTVGLYFPWTKIGEGSSVARITTDGTVELYVNTGATTYWGFTVTYIL